jgi:hypothetical protein
MGIRLKADRDPPICIRDFFELTEVLDSGEYHFEITVIFGGRMNRIDLSCL